MACAYASYAFDNFMDLSISIPRKAVKITCQVDLQECLSSFIQSEKMEDGIQFKCAKCGTVGDKFKKEMTVYRFPKVLVIHLKRFYNSTMRREKLNTTVKIPETYDFSPYAPHSSMFIILRDS